MIKSEAILTLNLFNEKVDKLINSRFVKHIQENGLKVSIKSSVNEGVSISDTFPDQDAIDAFILNLRFFIQDNESSSLRNMNNLYNEVTITPSLKNDFNFVRNKFNLELDKKTNINLRGNDITYREIFETFIYGELAHVNPDKKAIFDTWMKDKALASFIAAEFHNILFYFLNCIANIKKTNLKALEEITHPNK